MPPALTPGRPFLSSADTAFLICYFGGIRMRLNRTFAIAICLVCAFTFPSQLARADKDTPKTVASAAVTGRRQFAVANAQVNKLLARISTDQKFAEQLLESAKKNDKEGAAQLMKSALGADTEVVVEELKADWCVRIRIKWPKLGIDATIRLGGKGC